MTGERPAANGKVSGKASVAPAVHRNDDPAWANGLRDFYSSVVAEPLPDAFADLMRQLEEAEKKDE